MEWEKIVANNASNTGLISKITQTTYITQQQKNNPIEKWAKDLSRYSSKGDMQLANRHVKKCSTSLIIREVQVKTTVRYHLTLLRIAIVNNLQITNAGENVEKKEPPYTVGGNVNW